MSDYKKRLLEELDAAEQNSRKQLGIALNKRKPVEDRLAAFNGIGSISDEPVVRRALDIVDDAEADGRLRAAALEKISHQLGRDEAHLEKLTVMMADKNLPDPLREAALKALQANSFSSPTFLANRPTYMGALRALINDDNRRLSETAIEYLAMNKDEYVQRLLVEGLENPKKKLTKPELAVQYLAYDLHADHFPILRKLATNPPNKKTRMEALRNLAADSDSIGLMQETLADKEENPEVRHLCAVALQRMDPAKFEKAADSILRAKSEDAELKVALVNTKLHTPGTDVPKLATELKKVVDAATGRAVKARGQRLSSLISGRRTS